MKAQRRGSVSATETSRRTLRISTKWLMLALLSVASLAVSGCLENQGTANRRQKDKNGNLPHDVVRNFFELAQAEDYEAAKKLWYGPSKRISAPRKFEDFCAYYQKIDLSSCKIDKAMSGKSGFSIVRVHWQDNGKTKRPTFGLKIVGGEWKMERGYRW